MEKKLQENISYILQFIDSARFMASSLSNLVNNFSEWIHRIKCKFGHDDKKCETCSFLEYTSVKDDLIEYNCSICNNNFQIKFHEKLKERCFNINKFFNHDNNKFILLLQKGVYPYEYIDCREKFNETPLPEKGVT